MEDDLETSQECYNIPSIRDFWKKYKSHTSKRQHDDHHHHRQRSKNHISSNIKVVNTGDNHRYNNYKAHSHAFDDEFFKGSHGKMQDGSHFHEFDKAGQNGNGVEELNQMTEKHIHNNYHDQHYSFFKACIFLSVPKKKKVPSRVSSIDLPRTHSMGRLDRNLSKVESFESTPSIERSKSISNSRNEQQTPTLNTTSRPPSFNRTSTGARTASFNRRNGSFSRTASVGRSTSDVETKARKISVSRSGQMIMFSNSSGMLKPPATEKQLECTLEELYHGCVKHIKVSRGVFTHTGRLTHEEEVLTVQIKPGWKTGTKVTFQGAVSDEQPGDYPSDIVFVISEKHHPLFQRMDDDLELEIEIPLVDALTGSTLFIPILGREKMSIEIDDIVYPGYEKILVGQGMPNQKNPLHRGDLKVKFLVAYPNSLTDVQRSEISRILSN